MIKRTERYNYPEEVSLWIKQFIDLEDVNDPFLNTELALKDLFDRQMLHVEQISRFEDRIKKLEELAKKVEGLI